MIILIIAVLIILVGVIVSAFVNEDNEAQPDERSNPSAWKDGTWRQDEHNHAEDPHQDYPYQPPFK